MHAYDALELIDQSLAASLCAMLLTGMGYQHHNDSLDALLDLTRNFYPGSRRYLSPQYTGRNTAVSPGGKSR